MARQLENIKVWLIMDASGRAYGLPGGVVFYSWKDAANALDAAKASGQLPAKGLLVQPMVTPPIKRRHES